MFFVVSNKQTCGSMYDLGKERVPKNYAITPYFRCITNKKSVQVLHIKKSSLDRIFYVKLKKKSLGAYFSNFQPNHPSENSSQMLFLWSNNVTRLLQKNFKNFPCFSLAINWVAYLFLYLFDKSPLQHQLRHLQFASKFSRRNFINCILQCLQWNNFQNIFLEMFFSDWNL